ncbi:hypothetical protein B0T25DRAFT_599001 [Lasiosphaeria hispida]|uniref:DUF6604 domain-containing protein n=1 Tax=Lasiosphaeria hispida TaxID=260671 RepID=A0AAJ0MLG1_9PEZI|nr:hypothetical protein B0T25DRAFT_599001 [Lasiosphaeria hispida]
MLDLDSFLFSGLCTCFVASWLATTAKGCRYPSDLLVAAGLAEAPYKKPKTRGRAGKKPKPRKTALAAAVDAVKKYTVAIKDFIPLADYIASRKPPITVPDSVAATINRVIQASQDTASSTTTVNHGPTLENLFASLKVYESAEDLEEPLPSPKPPRPPDSEDPEASPQPQVLYEAEPQTSDEDALAAYYMMINDLNIIRSRVGWIWSNYKLGVFDCATAAVATNSAIDLARNVIEEIQPVLKDHRLYELGSEFYTECCFAERHTLEEAVDTQLTSVTYDIANATYMNSYRLLESLLVLDLRHMPLFKHGIYGDYDPTKDRGRMSGLEKFTEDKIVLLEIFTDLVIVKRGVAEMDKTGQIPFDLVFAVQIFLDIHHELRDQASAPFEFMMEQVMFMSNSLQSHLDFHENLKKTDSWPASTDQELRELIKKMYQIKQDPIYKSKAKVCARQGMPVPDEMQPNVLLRYSPVLSGLMLFHFRLELEGMLHESWKDMELVYGVLGGPNLHVGDRPRSPEEYFTRFCLHMGITAAAFANPTMRRRSIGLHSRAGPRSTNPKTVAPLSHRFSNRYRRNIGNLDWTPEDLDDIASRSKYVELVGSLALALQAETMELSFPWLVMHRQCWWVLRGVREECDSLLRAKYTPAYMQRESELPWVVGYIFMAASGMEARVKDMRFLEKAAVAVDAAIAALPDLLIRVLSDKMRLPVRVGGPEPDSDDDE